MYCFKLVSRRLIFTICNWLTSTFKKCVTLKALSKNWFFKIANSQWNGLRYKQPFKTTSLSVTKSLLKSLVVFYSYLTVSNVVLKKLCVRMGTCLHVCFTYPVIKNFGKEILQSCLWSPLFLSSCPENNEFLLNRSLCCYLQP